MKRTAALAIAWGLITFALAPAALGLVAVISVTPGSGLPGSTTLVIGSGFEGPLPIEIHAGSKEGALLGTGTASSGGIFGIEITIPSDAPPGSFVIYACGSCSSELFPAATTTFNVTAPPPTTAPPTTTLPPAPTDDPIPDPEPGEPEGDPATRGLWPGGRYGLTAHTGFQWTEARQNPGTASGWEDIHFELPEEFHYADYYIGETSGGDLTTSSPSQFAGFIGDTEMHLIVADPSLTRVVHSLGLESAGIDYFGFNVGWGVADRNFTTEEMEVSLSVRLVPFHDLGRGTTVENDWGTARVILPAEPVSITECLMLENPTGFAHDFAIYQIEISARTLGGEPFEFFAYEIDDVFFGVNEPPMTMAAPEVTTAEPDITVAATLPDIGEPPPDSSDLPWRIAFLLAGLLIGAGGYWAFRRD
jgi:hypothetical protein